MSDDLYQQRLLQHYREPHNYGPLTDADLRVSGYNALCGDRVDLALNRDGSQVTKIHFEGESCAICKASASIMTDLATKADAPSLLALIDDFHQLLTADTPAWSGPEELAMFIGVREFPARIKCAELPWRTLQAALSGHLETVTTEMTPTT